MSLSRIDKALSDMGIASRSEIKSMIKQGRVLVNGRSPLSPAEKFDTDTARISVDGKALEYKKFRYIMMNKPAGYLSATEDMGGAVVTELLAPELKRLGLFPAGRLDKDTEGLLILTNDGEFCHNVISPKKHVYKRYFAEVSGALTDEDARLFAGGMTLSDGTACMPGTLEITASGERSRCFVTICEGKYHQVKRMIAALGKSVVYLKRVSIGNLMLDGSLEPGGYREISGDELQCVFKNSK